MPTRKIQIHGRCFALLSASLVCLGGTLPLPAIESLDPLPEAIASFGAAESRGWLYVYGGHTGKTHQHSRENLSRAFRKLDLAAGKGWVELPQGPALQGLALVAQGEGIYRIGGLSANNAQGEPDDLHSVASVSRFDADAGTWTDVAPLPEPRSSHDAAVVGTELFVVGGWNLQGDDSKWHETACSADLSAAETAWKPLPAPPFQLRAISAAAASGKLWVIGGMGPDKKNSAAAFSFDPARRNWSKGPDFPGKGFGAAALGAGGDLFANGMDGTLYRLDAASSTWAAAGSLVFPRYFHRFASAPDGGLIALGGAGARRGPHLRALESVSTSRLSGKPIVQSWSVPFPGAARSRAATFLHGRSLFVFAGNVSLKQHDFGPESFVAEGYEIPLGALEARRLADFPVKRQSVSTVVAQGENGDLAFAVGGFGHDGEVAKAHSQVFGFDFASASWKSFEPAMKSPRTQMGLAERVGELWVFGGVDYDPRRGDEPFQFDLDVLKGSAKSYAGLMPADVKLPRPRRAFGGAILDDRYHLVGGMAEDFKSVTECDVFSFASRSWETIPAPRRVRISPELVSMNGQLYLAGGSSKPEGGELGPDLSIEAYNPRTRTWSVLREDLPLPPRDIRMFAMENRLLLVSITQTEPKELRLVTIEPAPDHREPAEKRAQRF